MGHLVWILKMFLRINFMNLAPVRGKCSDHPVPQDNDAVLSQYTEYFKLANL